MGRARLTLSTRPLSSLRSILSMASWASAAEEYVTKANPRCFESAPMWIRQLYILARCQRNMDSPLGCEGLDGAVGSCTSITSPARAGCK